MRAPPLTILFCLYLVPVVRMLLTPCSARRYGRARRAVNGWIGRGEWAVQWFRDSVLFVGWSGLLLYHGYLFAASVLGRAPAAPRQPWWILVGALGALGVSVWARWDRRRHRLALLAYAKAWPRLHPREFFHAFFAGFGPIPMGFPSTPPLLSLPILDFRDGHRGGTPRRRLGPFLHGACSTYFMAAMVLLAKRVGGTLAPAQVFDAVMQIWGARLLMLGRCKIVVEGAERLRDIDGQCICCFNHKSALDFAVGPAVMGLCELPRRSPFQLRYLAAKDHFLDNWLLYRGLGIGRAIEAAGMIFVNRRGAPQERQQAVAMAVEQVVLSGVDVAIYPQGTRAPGNVGSHGGRYDAGYFTAGGAHRLKRFGAHCRKGAAHLAVLAARRLSEFADRPPLYVVPIALLGTATALPKGALRVEVGTEVRVVIGTPLPVRVGAGEAIDAHVAAVHTYIDTQLEQLLGLRGQLAARFLTDARRLLFQSAIETVAETLKQWPADDRLLTALLDCIYAAPPSAWQPWLRAVAEHLAQGEPREGLVALYQKVVGSL